VPLLPGGAGGGQIDYNYVQVDFGRVQVHFGMSKDKRTKTTDIQP